MSRYILTPSAQQELVRIRDFYLEQAGQRVARKMVNEFIEAFRFLARTPGAGHKREDLAQSRPVLFWTMRDYYIIYESGASPLQIIAIVRGSRDVRAILQQRDD